MHMISTANIPMNHAGAADAPTRAQGRLAAFLTADDDWIAHHQGATIALLLAAALIVPEIIEWMI